MKIGQKTKLVIAIIVCQSAGIAGALFTVPSLPEWYAGLQKPALTPPDRVFAPVWILLYLLMGISLYFVWKGIAKPGAKRALFTFAIQLLLNVAWSAIFFGAREIFLAFLNIMILWAWILLTILRFRKISLPASYLLIPYFAWVSFAVYLNFYLWQLNG